MRRKCRLKITRSRSLRTYKENLLLLKNKKSSTLRSVKNKYLSNSLRRDKASQINLRGYLEVKVHARHLHSPDKVVAWPKLRMMMMFCSPRTRSAPCAKSRYPSNISLSSHLGSSRMSLTRRFFITRIGRHSLSIKSNKQ